MLGEEFRAGLAGESGIPVADLGESGVSQLERMMYEVAGNDERFGGCVDNQRDVTRCVTGGRDQFQTLSQIRGGHDLAAETRIEHRRNRVGKRILLAAAFLGSGPVKFVTDIDVFGVHKCRHPLAIDEMGIPAQVVFMKMSMYDQVDLVGREACSSKSVQPGPSKVIPERQGSLLAVADAGIDDDQLLVVLEYERLHTE